jgi:peptide/nickel transport system permease protein
VTRFIIRRLLWVIVLLFVVSFITFMIFYLFPSADPAALRAGKQATPDRIEEIRKQLGLADPWYQQYFRYVKQLVFHFDFGRSYQNNVDVREELFSRLPATISLAAGAAVIFLTVGITVGTISGTRRHSLMDRLTMGSSLVAISAPVYWLGLLSLYLFDKDFGKIPLLDTAGAYPDGGLAADPAKWFESLILPWLVLAATFTAVYARLLRGNLIEVMSEDYIRTARAKGLRERRVIIRHGVRSAITPLVTAAGIDIGVLLGGAILTESVFNIPGIGRLAYDSIVVSDLPMIQGTVLIGAFFIIIANFVVDILYALIDPRVTYS